MDVAGLAAARAVRRLADAERRRLLDLMLAVPEMTRRESRDFYVAQLEQRWAERLTHQRHANDRMDATSLMDALLLRENGVHDLVVVLRSVHPDAPEVTALARFAQHTFPVSLLEHAERVQLEELLDGVAPVWVDAAVSSATAGLAMPPPTRPRTLLEAIHHLEGYGQVPGGPAAPLLVFVADLAHQIGDPVAGTLRNWIEDLADRLELPRSEVRTMWSAAAARRARLEELSLLVRLDPDKADPDRYFVDAVLMHHDRTERVLHRDDESRTLDEVIVVLEEVLQSVPEVLRDDPQAPAGRAADPVIEFVLPHRLLREPVEEWEFGRDEFPLPLGLKYRVVVRSLDRLRNARHHADWRRRSQRLAEAGHRADPDAVHYLEPAPPSADPVAFARALYARLRQNENTVGLVVPHPPQPDLPLGGDVFMAGLVAGLPIVVWSRDGLDAAAFVKLVRETVARVPRQIPARVLEHRQEVAGTGNGPARLGLLYDDAARAPRSLQGGRWLEAPR